MRRLVSVAGVVLAIATSAHAGGDKSANSVVDSSSLNGGSNGFTNGTSIGAIKSAGCKIQGKITGISGLAAGDIVLCIGAAAVLGTPLGLDTPLGNAVLIRAVHSGGQIKFKADLTKIGCGNPALTPGGKIVSYNPTFACYKPDATYGDPTSPSTNWHTKCNGGALAVDPTPAVLATDDPAKVSVLGVCQGTSGTDNPLTPPASGKMFETGQTISSS